jgi:hypothetical protein
VLSFAKMAESGPGGGGGYLAWGVLVAGEGSDEDGRGRVHLKAALMLG